jgi:RHS repeat-associated protein
VGQRVARGNAPADERQYEYDAADNVVAIQDAQRGASRFSYDALLRLTSAATARKEADVFQYEAGDNLTQHNGRRFIYEPGSRLRHAGSVSFDYDANGNVIARHDGDRTTRYTYDAHMRLRAVELPDGARHEYAYDALGRRMAKRSPGREVRFVWSHRDLAAILPSDGPDVEVLADPVRHVPVIQWVAGEPEYFVGNHLGAPVALVRPGTGIVWSATYAPFGSADVQGEVTESATRCRLPGQYEDADTGLHYNYQRYYDPRIGRYLTPDPIGVDGGLNLYDYPRDPINWVDPLGLKCPNPKLVKSDPNNGLEIHEHDDGSFTITADCRKGFATPKPNGLRPTIHAGDDNKYNPPEAHLGKDGRLIVMEGTHRSAAASTGQQIPPDPDNPHLGGVPGKPGFMTYEYEPGAYDDDQEGVPLQTLTPPSGYPHKW